VVTLLAAAYVLWRHRARLVDAFRPEVELRAGAKGMAVALVLGFALNDSGVAVPGIMLLVALPVVVWIVLPADAGAPGVEASEALGSRASTAREPDVGQEGSAG